MSESIKKMTIAPDRDSNSPDWFLQSLVSLVNSDVEFPLTLQVKGLIVSGYAISGLSYIERFAKIFSEIDTRADDDSKKIYMILS